MFDAQFVFFLLSSPPCLKYNLTPSGQRLMLCRGDWYPPRFAVRHSSFRCSSFARFFWIVKKTTHGEFSWTRHLTSQTWAQFSYDPDRRSFSMDHPWTWTDPVRGTSTLNLKQSFLPCMWEVWTHHQWVANPKGSDYLLKVSRCLYPALSQGHEA